MLGLEVTWAEADGIAAAIRPDTAMVIVEAVALSIMASNGLALPLLLSHHWMQASSGPRSDMSRFVLLIRRSSIIIILLLAYVVYRTLAQFQSLVSIGLISFTAIAQVAPAFFGGLIWRNATANGAIAGMLSGLAIWFYTLLVPWMTKAGYLPESFVRDGPFDISALRPEALLFLQFDPLSHAVFWMVPQADFQHGCRRLERVPPVPYYLPTSSSLPPTLKAVTGNDIRFARRTSGDEGR